MEKIFLNTQSIIAIIILIAGIIYASYQIWKDVNDFKNRRLREAEERDSLNVIIANLSSKEYASRVAAAIMLRRFLQTDISKKYHHLQTETINVISSMIKILPTGVFQKTLADGLAYATDLSRLDLQKSNLQDAYIGKKDGGEINMSGADLYMSDLSYALMDNVRGNIVFYRAILFHTKIKNCHLENSNFCEADLTNTAFQNVYLNNADFTRAKNIPSEIKQNLKEKNGKSIYEGTEAITTRCNMSEQVIFMSVPSIMSKENELLTKDYKAFLESRGYYVIYYVRDDYPQFGQLNKIKEKIISSTGMIAFGLKQTNIQNATYRPHTTHEAKWNDKWLSTPWNEIEVGMGIMRGIPILMVKDSAIEDGIFDSHLSECFVSCITTDVDSRQLANNKEMNNWLSRL